MFNSAGKNIKKKKKVTVNIFKKLTENMLEEFFLSLPAIIDRKSEQKSGNYFFWKDAIELKCKLLKLKKAK